MTNEIRQSICNYCAEIGQDPLLVQGAGGNISWKEDNVLWIKASGTWLADANNKDIFLPVDLDHLQTAIKNRDFSVTPIVNGNIFLKPSIETLLHAVMPHKVVLHLHAVDILAYLVRHNFESDFIGKIDPSIHWTIVNYYKPGQELASAIHDILMQNQHTDVVFLKNHGVIIGGSNIECVGKLLRSLIEALKVSSFSQAYLLNLEDIHSPLLEYKSLEDLDIQQFAFNPDFFNHLFNHWALYPDHVVFLGPKAYIYDSVNDAVNDKIIRNLFFIKDVGVFIGDTFNQSHYAQLRCYYDVLLRQQPNDRLNCLNEEQIASLVNWDAEHYRKNLEKQRKN